MIRFFHLLYLLLFSISLNAQVPWIPKSGLSYVQAVFSTLPNYDLIYGESAKVPIDRFITDNTLALYGELGLSNKIGLTIQAPFSMLRTGDAVGSANPTLPSGTLAGLGNLSFSGKYLILNKQYLLSFIGQIDLPTSTEDRTLGLNTGLDAYTFMPRLALGSSGSKWYGYANLGYGFRTNNHHDLLVVVLEYGYKLSEKSTVILNLMSYNSIKNGDENANEAVFLTNGLYSSLQEFQAFQLKFFQEKVISNYGLFFSIGGGPGRYVSASPAFSFGIFGKW